MAVTPVTPVAGSAVVVTIGGTAVVVFPAGIAGGFITNPQSPTDQGIGAAEPLYVNPVTTPGGSAGDGNGTTFVLSPGATWNAIPGQSTVTRVNAGTSGHKFTAVYWM